MSEVQSRPAASRGRGGSSRGRGGFSGRGRARGGHATAGDKPDTTTGASIEDDGEVTQMKKRYGDKVTTIKELFPNWTDADIVFALQETDGDLETAVDRISEGSITQWGEVSTKKDRSKSKVKESAVAEGSTHPPRTSRGGRADLEGRGGRGRGTERGRGGRARGASSAQLNGSHAKDSTETSVPTNESSAWDTINTPGDTPTWETGTKSTTEETVGAWATAAVDAASTSAAAAANATSSIIPDGVKKSWASMFAKPASVPSTKASEPSEKHVETPKTEESASFSVDRLETNLSKQPEIADLGASTPAEVPRVEPDVVITPSKDDLTEDNLEQIPDASNPAPTATAASTAASSWDPRNASTAGTPYSLSSGVSQAVRPPTSGYQASALKATGAPGRSSSFQRRILDQEEAVRMPGNREVDRAAVQFGAFNLGDGGDDDVDGEREEPETRAQPPQHSPIAPRAALPPMPQSGPSAENFPTAKQTTGLPSSSHVTSTTGLSSPQLAAATQSSTQQTAAGSASYNQYGRYGQGAGQDLAGLPQKPYDSFSQQVPSSHSSLDNHPSQHSQIQQSGAYSSAPDQYSSYYATDSQQRNAYNSYQQQYGLQHGAQGHQDGSAQRSYGGYGGPQGDAGSSYPQSAGQQPPSRYATGSGEGSGNNTPNPSSQAQQQGTSQGTQPQQPGHPQQPQAGNYPYGHPYYSSPYYAAYMNQYQQYGGGNYGAAPYGGKNSLHQPYHGYGMSPSGGPYEHASSPVTGGFGGSGLHGRDSGLGGSLTDYGRAGSAQSGQNPQGLGGSGAFGGHDPFARQNAFPNQSQQHYNGSQSNQAGSGDDLKPFGETKAANGPSPSLSQAGRPSSATNTATGSALPHPQSQQGGYGGYPAHLQQQLHSSQANSYGGLGGAGGHQASGQGHQGNQHGAYGQSFAGYNYGNYGNTQQRGGWGGNYGGH